MDPYELFSTPPTDLMLTSTPAKGGEQRKKRAVKLADRSINKSINKSLIDSDTENTVTKKTIIKKAVKKKVTNKKSGNKKDQANLWDKCLESDPKLKEFVTNFNQSLETALSKPLDQTE